MTHEPRTERREVRSARAPETPRFLLERRVGRGASGEVWAATDRASGTRVALKVGSDDHAARQRLEREADLLASVDSPHVVKPLGRGIDGSGRPWLALEWLEGSDLRLLLRARRVLGAAHAVRIVRRASLGLDALHRAGLVHADVKPSNLFVLGGDDEPDVRLIDLGVARRAGVAAPELDGLVVGTPAFMSPEQARGDTALEAASDVFSLGVVLYQLLAGRRPFTGRDPFALLAKVLLEEPPRLGRVARHLPRELDAIVARALAKRPEDRFASAIDLADALATVSAAGVSAMPPRDDVPTMRTAPLGLPRALEQRVTTTIFAAFEADDADAASRFATMAGSSRALVQPTLGGRVLAVFGAAVSTGDEAQRAARTALDVLDRIPAARLALTTGRTVADAAGPSGESIDRGTHDLDRAPVGRVLLDGPTARLLGGAWPVMEEDGQRFLAAAGSSGPTAAGPRLLGRELPCLGREALLADLESTWDEATRGTARAVLVTGPAGIGKSRLRYELVRRLRARGEPSLVLLARGDSVTARAPFGMAAQLVRQAVGIAVAEPQEAAQDKILARAVRTVGGKRARAVAEMLGELCGVHFPDRASRGLRAARRDAMLMGDAQRGAWIDWIESESDVMPVLLVLEDLQWADRSTLRLVDHALSRLGRARLLVLALARPEIDDDMPRMWSEIGAARIVVGPLDSGASATLVREALGAAVTDEAIDTIVARADGNPFCLEELVRAAVAPARSALPETVQGLLQARLDALGAEAKLVLRAASVFGRTFWRGGVDLLAGAQPRDERTDAVLRELVQTEIVLARQSSRFPGETEYAFRHGLLHDAVHATLAEPDLARAHRLAATWLERAGETDATTLAQHFELGGETARAAVLHRRGAEQALEGNDLDGVIERAERGVRCGASGDTLGALRVLQAEAHRWRGAHGLAFDAAVDGARHSAGGSATWFRAAGEAALASGRLGRLDRVARWLDEACAVAPAGARDAAGDPIGDAERAKIICLARGVMHLVYGGQAAQAGVVMDLCERLVDDEALLDPLALARLHQMRAVRRLHEGDPAGYLAAHEAALAAFEAVGDERSASLTRVSLGSGYADLGAYARAEAVLRDALAASERLGLGSTIPWALQNLGHVLSRTGSVDEGEALVRRALELAQAQGDPRLSGGCRIYLSMIAERRGDTVRAIAEAESGEAVLEAVPAMRAGAVAARARALLAAGRSADALDAARRAMSALAALGHTSMGELEPAVRLTLVLSLRAGADDSWRSAAGDAARRLEERASRVRDQALRASFLERVPDHALTLALAAEAVAPAAST